MKWFVVLSLLCLTGFSQAQKDPGLESFAKEIIQSVLKDGSTEELTVTAYQFETIATELDLPKDTLTALSNLSNASTEAKTLLEAHTFNLTNAGFSNLDYDIKKVYQTVFADFILTISSGETNYLFHVKNAALINDQWRLTHHLYIDTANFLDQDFICECLRSVRNSISTTSENNTECLNYLTEMQEAYDQIYIKYGVRLIENCEEDDEEFEFDEDLENINAQATQEADLNQFLTQYPLACDCAKYILEDSSKPNKACRKTVKKLKKTIKKESVEGSVHPYILMLSYCN